MTSVAAGHTMPPSSHGEPLVTAAGVIPGAGDVDVVVVEDVAPIAGVVPGDGAGVAV